MATSSPVANLLVLATQDSELTSLIGVLQEGGIAIDGQRVETPEALRARLDAGPHDLIVCCAQDPDLDLDAMLATLRELETGIPLLLTGTRDRHAADLNRAARHGARDLIDCEDHAHLRWAVARELADRQRGREYRELAERLRECERQAQTLVETSQDAVAFLQAGMHIQANPAYRRRFGHETLEDLQAVTFLDLIAPDGRKAARDFLHAAEFSSGAPPGSLEVECLDAGGQSFPARLSATLAEQDGETCVRLVVHELAGSAPPALADQVPDLSLDLDLDPGLAMASPPAPPSPDGLPPLARTADPLGEAAGRRLLLDRIESHIGPDRAARLPLTVFYIQVLRGPQILNDRGLTQGFDQIAAFGAQLQGLIDRRCWLARVTDTGFGLLAVGIDEAEAESLAAGIRAGARLPRRIPVRPDAEPDCEVGMMAVNGRAAAAADMLDTAFRQCMARVGQDPNQSAGMRRPTSLAARRRQTHEDGDSELVSEIQRALDNEQFRLAYQPIISLLGDSQEHYSVLLRLHEDEETQLVEAKDFIEAAIRGGLIEEIDRWTIRAAIRTLSDRRRAGQPINFFINLAEDTFRNPDLIVWICDCLREFDVGGQSLTFQFQEELALDNLSSLGKLAEALRKVGVRIAINRFGVQDNPDLLLQALPVDFVLLSPDYAQRLAEDKTKQKRLIHLANLARDFNLKSVVTGVEDARALTVLWTANVDYVQGNFLQRPSTALEFQQGQG